MEAVLVMFDRAGTAREFPLLKATTIIGRGADCDLRIPLSGVSRKHCQLVMDSQFVRVEDLGSANGTYVNGERVELVVLAARDVIRVADVSITVTIDGEPAVAGLKPPRAKMSSGGSGGGGREVVEAGEAGGMGGAGAFSSKPVDGGGAMDDEIDRILLGDDKDESGFIGLSFDDDEKDEKGQ